MNSVTSLHEFVDVYWRVLGNEGQVVLKLVVVQGHSCRAKNGVIVSIHTKY